MWKSELTEIHAALIQFNNTNVYLELLLCEAQLSGFFYFYVEKKQSSSKAQFSVIY